MAAGGGGMTDAPAVTIVKEMGYSLGEFARVLPSAMRDWLVSGEPGQWQVCIDGQPAISVLLVPQPPRRIGMLSIPVSSVTIRFERDDPAVVTEFMTRFDRGFHRGGG
jgi:hypothetical protein